MGVWVGFNSPFGLGLAPHLGFGPVLLFVFLLGLRLKGQHLPAETLLVMLTEVTRGKTNCTKIFQTSVCILSANTPLAKSSDARLWGQESMLCPQ